MKRNGNHEVAIFFLMFVALLALLTFPSTAEAQTRTTITSLNDIGSTGDYLITGDINANGFTTSIASFSGTLTAQANDDGTFPVISNLSVPIFGTASNATISNIMLKNVKINQDGDVGAIACTANGTTKIYNCGILPSTPDHAIDNRSTVASSNNRNCGSLVGKLDGTARVVNCFSYANVTKGGGGSYYVGGLVGNNAQSSSQGTDNIKTIVVNCIFYGDISNCSNYSPVFGNKDIDNSGATGINPYCFFSAKDGTFANASFTSYKHSWPAAEEYLTRFEYYRSIFNSNRRLCTWWVNGTYGTAPTDADVTATGIAKWVLDESIAPYPILKKWGKYPCITNPDPVKVWDTATGDWVQRTNAQAFQGRIISEMGPAGHEGTLKVIVKAGSNNSTATDKELYLPITDMDTLHYDYCYAKVQLPYYNEQFGNPNGATHAAKYGNNYTNKVVTGWKVTGVVGGTPGTFEADWEHGYNFADRNCTDKDKYDVSGRVFAQGGYYYVPEGVTEITIEAYWGKAVYLHNTGHYIDRVKMTNQTANGSLKLGEPFKPADTLLHSFEGQTVYDNWNNAVKALDEASNTNGVLSLSVYDQAVVLLSNFQIRNENNAVGTDINNGKWYPYTLMSADLDFDNEPDYCFEFQFRKDFGRPGIQPIRFDFLPVPELGLAVRHSTDQNTIGIFIPKGHFEITETSFMHTTQFEYDGGKANKISKGAPVILNGGHFEQIVVRYASANSDNGDVDRTNYFIMGGHFRMQRFTPGAHTNTKTTSYVRLCAVNAIGGEYPEFYLSGIYRPDIVPQSVTNQGNPHCYINGGKFGLIAGAGYDKILGDITFKIDHAVIGEFYGGGINGSNPVGGSIVITIDHSLVGKYCGGPKVGVMANGKTVTTHATGTTFTKYYGGGNGGTSYYREQKQDGNVKFTNPSTVSYWNQYGYSGFNPLNTISGVNPAYQGTGDNKGYHALFEFECFVESNGIGGQPTIRSYLHWAQFGTTSTGNVTNDLDHCTIENNYYGGGNLANVSGTVKSTLNDCIVKGNVFGGGFSGTIEPFRIHDKSNAHFPYIDKAGVMQDGMNGLNSLEYIDREYTWCYKNASGQMFPAGVEIPSNVNTNNPTFQAADGKWYVLTTVSLEGLGAVSSNVEINLTGETKVGTDGDSTTGNVFGGGDESAVNGNTTVILEEGTHVHGNVYGGGNEGRVGGNSVVKIQNQSE